MAQTDFFLKIQGVEGESADSKHKGEIDLESFSWGETNSGTHSTGGGGGAGRVAMQDFHFVMQMNKASTKLMEYCATGFHIPTATLVCRKAGGEQEDYLTVKFSDLMVSSFQTGASAQGGLMPIDQISLNFAKIQVDYKAQGKAGQTANAGSFGWDVKANKKV